MTMPNPPARETRHTPGPWFLINDCCVGGPIEPGWEEAGCGIAHCGMRARTEEEAAANARLIAAAPSLLEALRSIASQCEIADDPEHHTLSLVKHIARNAVCEATGG